MLGGPELGGVPAEAALRVPQLPRLQDPTAPVALIAPGGGGAAVRAGAEDVPVGEEPVVLGQYGFSSTRRAMYPFSRSARNSSWTVRSWTGVCVWVNRSNEIPSFSRTAWFSSW